MTIQSLRQLIFDKASNLSRFERINLIVEYGEIRQSVNDSSLNRIERMQAIVRANEIRTLLTGEVGSAQQPEIKTEPLPESTTPRQPTAHLYGHDEKRTKGKRQKANNAAIELLRRVQSGELSREQLTEADKRTLAAYSGNGGGLIGADGKKGSDYEYYTPAPIAAGIWDALVEMGFSGGKILDPCSGTGIFGATAPNNAVVDAVELDQTSGSINDLVNSSPSFNVTIAPFEAVASATPDEVYDAVVSNVPFSKDVDARGGNQKHDPKYQKEPMESYFILRSLDKLKPNGLAAFIVPPRVVSGRDARGLKLRERASLKAEFLGAYRLPNSVFGAADADTITDVIFFRKFSTAVAEKIAELREQAPETLSAANVLWQPFLDGQYFKGEGKRFILGEFVPKNPDDFRPVDRVVNPASVAEIGKMLRRFPKSRIQWDTLDAVETTPIQYQEGDTLTQDGQTLQLQNGIWVALQPSENSFKTDAWLGNFETPYSAFEAEHSYADAMALRQALIDSGRSLDIPAWLASAINALESTLPNPEARAAAWPAIVTGLSVVQVIDERAGESGVNFLEEYAALSQAMQAHAGYAKKLKGFSGEINRALLTINTYYTRQDGYSAVWRGDIHEPVQAPASKMHGFEGLLYRNQSQWVTLEQARAVFGADFDPINSDDWCMSSDGQSVCRANDYYVGNLGDFLVKIDQEMAAAPNDTVRAKLMRQKAVATTHVDTVDASRMTFNLFSPYVSIEEKLDFVQRFVHPSAFIELDEEGKPSIAFDLPASKLTNREKLIKRFGNYLKKGTVTLGGVKLDDMSNDDAIKALRKITNTANEQFNAWVRGNDAITSRIAARANDPTRLRFRQVEDDAPLSIPGMKPDLTLHGYQTAFVRASARDFSGINGFDVGLGKTFTALAAVQNAHAMGVKKKTLFVVPNSVLSNWQKEVNRAYTSTDDCLYVGLRDGQVKSSAYDEDLTKIKENRHSKIFVTMEAFERIRLRDESISGYEAYMRSVDASFAESEDRKKDERSKSKLSSIMEILSGKSGAAPYLEDLGIDSLVVDEAHAYKNSAATVEFKGGKYLSLSPASKRGLDMQAKAWVIRGMSGGRGDGVMLLTATPITNSPLEIYSMLSLAVGHDRVNDLLGGKEKGEAVGIAGSDDFMYVFCQLESEEDVTIDGQVRQTNVFRGLNNTDLLRRSLRQSATIKDATDVGGQIKVPEAPEQATAIALSDETRQRLELYKSAYRFAADELREKKPNRGSADAYMEVERIFGEDMSLIGHPFNLINKMTMLIADPELDRRITRYLVSDADLAIAEQVVAKWNEKPPTEKRTRPGPNATEEAAISVKVLKDEDGYEIGKEYTMPVKAWIENGAIVIDSTNPDSQDKLEALAAKFKLDFDVSIPPKLAALLENVQVEAASPRGIDADGNRLSYTKQLIFCDLLGMHNKIKTLLTKHAGVPASAIAIVTGQRNNSAEDILEIQDGFNATGADNKYRVIIANEKAEVGINLQKGTQAIHHLTIGWTPDSLTQRNGRGVRQGNQTESVTIYYYDADGTFDTAKRTLVNSKADWIDGLMANDGEDQIEISGGMSREQMEMLIDAVGDTDAITRIQEVMAAKEAEKRASTNREKQRINLDTILRQNKFLAENAEPKMWIARYLGQYLTLYTQRLTAANRAEAAKSASARAKNEALLAQLDTKIAGLESQINEAATIRFGGYSTTTSTFQALGVLSPADVVKQFLSNAKRGENRAADLIEKFKDNRVWINGKSIQLDINENADLIQDWKSEIDMAQKMRDESVERYEKQATYPGGLPSGVARAMAEGHGLLVGEIPVIEECFIDYEGDLYVVDNLKDGVRTTIKSATTQKLLAQLFPNCTVIYPNTPEYEAALTRAAEIEDTTEDVTVYSDTIGAVAARRKTPILAFYNAGYGCYEGLPLPYFPIPIKPDMVENNPPVLSRIFEEQKGIIQKWSKKTNWRKDDWRFGVLSTVEMIELDGRGTEFIECLRDYAIAHNLKLTRDDLLYKSSEQYSNIKTIIEIDASSEVLEIAGEEPEIDAINEVPLKLLAKHAPWLDLTGFRPSEIDDMMPSSVIFKLSDLTEAAAKRAKARKLAEDKASGKISDTDIVLVVGNTFKHKEQIKEYATKHGDGYTFDKPAGGWRMQRKAFEKLIEDFPKLDREIHIKE